MSELESKPYLAGGEAGADADSMRFQLNLLRAGLILLTALFAGSIFLQVHYLRVERANLKPLLEGFDREKASLDALMVKIAEYGRTHPAFMPIMQKYSMQVPTNAPATPAAAKPATAPKPSPATAPKK